MNHKFLFLMMAGFATIGLGTAQSVSINSVEPSSVNTVVGQSFSIGVRYSTNNVNQNSCTLGYVDSSVPSNWDSEGELAVDQTGGSTSSTTSPKITTASPAQEAELTLELQCASNTGDRDPRNTASINVNAENPPFLEGDLDSSSSIEVTSGGTHTVTFSVSNTGSSDTESAKAIISSPSGFDHPSSINLKEAGQDEGVIRADQSAGTTSFDFSANNGFNSGTLQIELTSTAIGVTDTVEIQLTKPDASRDDEEGSTSSSPGGGGPPITPASPENTRSDNKTKLNKTGNKTKGMNNSRKAVVAESRNGVAQVNITKEDGVNGISVEVRPVSGNAPVKNIVISSDMSGKASVSVRDMGREKPEKVPEEAGRDVYNYQEINTSINDSEIDAAEIDFRVNKSWLEERNGSTDSGVMKRYTNESWKSLETRHINSTKNVHNFEARSEGFSYYVVALEDGENQTREELAQDRGGSNSLYLILAVVILVALAGYVWMRRRESSDEYQGDF